MRALLLPVFTAVLCSCQGVEPTPTPAESPLSDAPGTETPSQTASMDNAEFARHWARRMARELDVVRIFQDSDAASTWTVRAARDDTGKSDVRRLWRQRTTRNSLTGEEAALGFRLRGKRPVRWASPVGPR